MLGLLAFAAANPFNAVVKYRSRNVPKATMLKARFSGSIRSSSGRVRDARYLKLVEHHRPGDELLRGHSRVKVKPNILCAAALRGDGESEREGSPTRHHSDDHRTFLKGWSTFAYKPPFQSPWTKQLAFILTFELIRPRGQHDELRDTVIVNPSVGKIH
jgi:hypothetical protein